VEYLLKLIVKQNHEKSRNYGKFLPQRIRNNIQDNKIDRPECKRSTEIMRNHNQVVLGYISTACHIIDLE
jgi:predicted RNA-binding protein (virulence factor B family)